VRVPGSISGLEVLGDGSALAVDADGGGWAVDFRREAAEPLPAAGSLVAARQRVFFVSGRAVWEYERRNKTVTQVGNIRSGARSMDTWEERVAFGFEGGEVVLGTRAGTALATTRLTARPAGR
jgi:hypothetical protein